MTTKNEYISVLEDKIQQDGVYQAVRMKTDWLNVFNNLGVQIHAFGARYLIDVPIPGKDWRPDLSIHNPASGYSRKIPMAYIDIPAIIDKVYHCLIPEDRLLECLSNPARLKELTTQLKGNVSVQMLSDIKDALRIIWTTDANYWPATWDATNNRWNEDGNLFSYHPDKYNDIPWVYSQIFNTSDEFLEVNTRFQKGFFYDGPVSPADTTPKVRTNKTHWNFIPTNTLDEKSIYVILNNRIDNSMRIGKAGLFSPAYVELKNTYGKVFKTKLPNNYEMIMQDSRVSVLRPRDNNKGFEHKYEPENQTNWFFLASKVYGGMVYCLNNCAWKSDATITDAGRK